jgi:hypothetical protein
VFLDNGPADPEPKPRMPCAVFRGEERIEHALPYLRQYAGAVVRNRQTQNAVA